jgi:hypothetical protein
MPAPIIGSKIVQWMLHCVDLEQMQTSLRRLFYRGVIVSWGGLWITD